MCKRRKTFIFLAKKTVHLRPPAAVVKANLIKLKMKPSIKQVKIGFCHRLYKQDMEHYNIILRTLYNTLCHVIVNTIMILTHFLTTNKGTNTIISTNKNLSLYKFMMLLVIISTIEM